jgi:hypothetical protein
MRHLSGSAQGTLLDFHEKVSKVQKAAGFQGETYFNRIMPILCKNSA